MKRFYTFAFFFVLILIGSVSKCHAQKKDSVNHSSSIFIPFDALNGAKIKQASQAFKFARIADSIRWSIVREMFQVKSVDLSTISTSGDSLIVTPEGIRYKPKRK